MLAKAGFSLNAWMSLLPDSAYLSELSFPGTHNSGTGQFAGLFAQYYRCQNLTILQTLEKGARFVDVRLGYEDNELWLWHGGENMGVKFAPVLDDIKHFPNYSPDNFAQELNPYTFIRIAGLSPSRRLGIVAMDYLGTLAELEDTSDLNGFSYLLVGRNMPIEQ